MASYSLNVSLLTKKSEVGISYRGNLLAIKQYRRTLLKQRHPLIGGVVKTIPIDKNHLGCIKVGQELFTNFVYRELFKWKKALKDELVCKNCLTHLLITAAYLKCHTADYPHTTPLCIWIMKNSLLPEGQEFYASYNLRRAKIFDLTQNKMELGDLADDIIYKIEKTCLKQDAKTKMVTRELPSPKAFPSFNLDKESKMWLCNEKPPPEECILSVKEKIRKVILKYGPKEITIPAPEAVKSLGPSLYSDGHVPRCDFEKPEITWKYSWTYQKFKTDAQTEREIWLPPKSYKMCSSWWHFYVEPICKKIPWLVSNDTMKEVRLNLHKRFKPCKSIDLKGFGLQFPHEYILGCMDVINEVYPCEEAEEYRSSVANMLRILSVKMDDGTHVKPIRGVGLGYFSNIMSLVVASLLEEFDVVQMFNDDILIPSDHYEKGIKKLTDHKFIINEKKSGHMWHKVPMFANVSMARNGTLMYYEVQGLKAAVFLKKYHYERKSIHIAAPWVYRWKQTFHYERIFGYEVRRLESQDHPSDLGLTPSAPFRTGWVKGGLLRKYKSPKDGLSEEERRIWSISFPWKTPKDDNFRIAREKAIQKYKDHIWYTEYDEYLNPRIEDKVDGKTMNPDFFLAGYSLPRWADLQSVLFNHETTGRTTMGTYPKRAAYYMLNYLLSDNPIHSWISGGYDVISPFYRIPGVSNTILMLYDSLKKSNRLSSKHVLKRCPENEPVYLSAGSGIEFMKNIMNQDYAKLENFDVGEIISYESDEDESQIIDLDDDLDIDYPDEDGQSSAGDFDAEELW
ncbi:MAG: RNA-dependent RNA polymerase [Verticillium dahliae ormycovirus 2]|nr:MAG: RNA-dependent RNA polymerase [Verticillium dahliae ormycovirus 2]